MIYEHLNLIQKMTLIDKQLSASNWYELTNTGDFWTTEDELSTLQAAQNRILATLESRIYDDNFWWLLEELRNTPVQKITNAQVYWYIEDSLQPLIDANRVIGITSVNIVERNQDSIQVEIKLDLDLSVWTLNINIAV